MRAACKYSTFYNRYVFCKCYDVKAKKQVERYRTRSVLFHPYIVYTLRMGQTEDEYGGIPLVFERWSTENFCFLVVITNLIGRSPCNVQSS